MIKKTKNERALSLIEVLVTVLILSISILTLIQGISQGIMVLDTAEGLSEAALLAKKKMAELELEKFEIGVESSGVFEENKKYSWKVDIKDPELDEAKNFAISQVDLFILWKDQGTEKQIKISTYASQVKKMKD